MTEVTVVMACKNEARYLDAMLESLARQSWDGAWEVIVADNGSTDETCSIAESFSGRLPRLVVIDASARAGAGYSRNRGVEASSGTKILFLDADDAVNDGYVAAMAKALDERPLVSAQLELERLNPSSAVLRRDTPTRSSGPLDPQFGFLPYAGGGAMGVSRAVFEEVGGFHLRPTNSWRGPAGISLSWSGKPFWFEEADLCWRIQLAGYPEPVFVPNAIVHYRLPADLRSEYRRGRDYMRGQLALYRVYRDRGMAAPHRASMRNLVGAVRLARTREGAALAASTLGRFVGQWTPLWPG